MEDCRGRHREVKGSGSVHRRGDGLGGIYNITIDQDKQITYLLTDLYNNEYWTPVLPE